MGTIHTKSLTVLHAKDVVVDADVDDDDDDMIKPTCANILARAREHHNICSHPLTSASTQASNTQKTSLLLFMFTY